MCIRDREGSDLVSSGTLRLRGWQVPPGVFGAFIAARGIGSSPLPGGTLSTPCLAAPIALFGGPGQVMRTGPDGAMTLQLDLTALPTVAGSTPALPGETWMFQLWHRSPGSPGGSTFTDAVAVTFR